MKRLWVELQRWNNQRVPVCVQCGPLSQRIRRPVASTVAMMHRRWNPTHAVKVRRRG